MNSVLSDKIRQDKGQMTKAICDGNKKSNFEKQSRDIEVTVFVSTHERF